MNQTTHYKICPRCQSTQALTAAFCTGCGRQFRSTSPMPSVEERRPVPPQAKTDLCATAAFACACAGFWIFGGLFGAAAVILGMIARQRIRDDAPLKGKGLAVAGQALGVIELIYAAYLLNQAIATP